MSSTSSSLSNLVPNLLGGLLGGQPNQANSEDNTSSAFSMMNTPFNPFSGLDNSEPMQNKKSFYTSHTPLLPTPQFRSDSKTTGEKYDKLSQLDQMNQINNGISLGSSLGSIGGPVSGLAGGAIGGLLNSNKPSTMSTSGGEVPNTQIPY